LEGSAVPDGVLEVSAVPKGVAHVLVVRTLGIEDVVQCSLASMGCPSSMRDGWSGGVNLVGGLISQRLSGCWFASRSGASGAGFVPPMRS
jgi:hypothetical protein